MSETKASQQELDPVPKVDGELAVGEDVAFQRKWWSFEKAVFILFTIIIFADLLGAFGRGYLARAETSISGSSTRVAYERIERAGTPSILSIHFSQDAVKDGQVTLWMNEVITQQLGNQRIIPEPGSSTLADGGIRYHFPISGLPATAQFALQPAHPGIYELQIRIGDGQETRVPIVVMP